MILKNSSSCVQTAVVTIEGNEVLGLQVLGRLSHQSYLAHSHGNRLRLRRRKLINRIESIMFRRTLPRLSRMNEPVCPPSKSITRGWMQLNTTQRE
jgi:hypothetical protein